MAFRRLLASDIDGTLLVEKRPDPEAVDEFVAWRTTHPEVALAYVTGRSQGRALEVIAEHGLPVPDALVASVGTEIRWRRGERWKPDDTWAQRLASTLGGRELAHADAVVLEQSGTELQDDAEQSRFKRSYRRPAGPIDGDAVARRLSARGLPLNVIASVDPLDGAGLLDLLPRDTDKGHAVEHLRARLRLDHDAVAFCGDSGNDLAALLRPWWSIVVANANPQVRARFAAGRDDDRRSVLGEGEVLHGVLDGLRAIGWHDASA